MPFGYAPHVAQFERVIAKSSLCQSFLTALLVGIASVNRIQHGLINGSELHRRFTLSELCQNYMALCVGIEKIDGLKPLLNARIDTHSDT
jgi:hypothetical protein